MADVQHSSRAAIDSSQLEQLRSLVAELIPANRFYTRKFQDAGAGFDIASLEDFSARFPFTTKQELAEDQLASPPFGTNLTCPLDRYPRFHQTSGTSGAPLRWLDTRENWDAMLDCWAEVFRAAGIGAGDRVFFAFSFGPFIGFWLAYESAQRLGCLCIPGGGMGSEVRARAILDTGATVLCCTPTYAIRLGEVAACEKLDMTRSCVKHIVVAGEPGGSLPGTRKHIETLWPGARVFDHHGMTETGPVTYECPTSPGVLHIIESAFIAEVIDPKSGKAAASGELVLTTLTRTGSPVLRYRTGDVVKLASHDPKTGTCSCGRHEIALDGGILGRVDDMIIVRGVNVYPGAVEEILRGFGDVAEYRVRVCTANALAEMRVEIEPAEGCPDAKKLAAVVSLAFENALALRVPVILVEPGSLPRFEMKSRRWIKE